MSILTIRIRCSVAIADIRTKVETEAKSDRPERDSLLDFTSNKIQDGDGRHFKVGLIAISYNVVAVARFS